MDATDRFVAEVTGSGEPRLDIAALCIAGHAHPGLDLDEWVAKLDEIAHACRAQTVDGIRRSLVRDCGFTGNRDDYNDPENSFLDSVMTRRLGIPISLSVLTMEVGRRLGVSFAGVGMPGHFLLTVPDQPGAWYDAFDGWALLNLRDCEKLFRRLYGDDAAFAPSLLAPTPPRAILARMLANLEAGPLAADPANLAWMCTLHASIPGLPRADRVRLARLQSRWN